MSAVIHAPGCPARPCFEQYHGANEGGVNYTRITCGAHPNSTRAGYDPFRCSKFNPNACACHAQRKAA